MEKRSRGRPYKEIYINVQEFIDMVRFIKNHPVDRTRMMKDVDAPIPETGKAYWREALDQLIECLVWVDFATPMTSAKRVKHDKKISRYSDDRYEIYEYIRTQIIEKNGGDTKTHEN